MTQDSEIKETLVKKWKPRGRTGLKVAPGGPNFMIIRPVACLIWSENIILGQKTILGAKFMFFFEILGHLKKSWKIQNFILVPGVRKTDFYDLSGNFYEKNPEYGNLEWDDDSGNLEWDDGNQGTASEPYPWVLR